MMFQQFLEHIFFVLEQVLVSGSFFPTCKGASRYSSTRRELLRAHKRKYPSQKAFTTKKGYESKQTPNSFK